ncbi:MAG: hydroxymethylbilane synthase [Caulobacteraceae bacterium]
MAEPLVRIGTRASKLALAQAGMMQRAITRALGRDESEAETVAPLIHITTSGDRIQDRRLLEVGGKGLFTKEIEEALLDGRIDCAIHSLKDMPAELPPGLVIAATPKREDPRDAFLSTKWTSLEDLPQGARLGTASLRRQAQALHRRPDLDVQMLRGNVDTRIAKLEAGEADAILLAYSGLRRLGLADVPKSLLDPEEAPPAPGQGVLAIETREDRADQAWVAALNDPETVMAVAAERGAMLALEGSCKTAIGAYASAHGETLRLVVEALTPDGKERFRAYGLCAMKGGIEKARALGLRLGQDVLREGGDKLILADDA